MAPPLLLMLTLSALFLSPTVRSQPPLTTSYYSKTCPQFEQIVQDTTINKQIASPTTAGAALRLFFHDCFVRGCDASVLVTSTRFNKAERDADINLSLPGDGFDVVVRAKTALELTCPGVVSCADILAVATRNLVVMMGGPYYTVKLGRKDSLTSGRRTSKVTSPGRQCRWIKSSKSSNPKDFPRKKWWLCRAPTQSASHTAQSSAPSCTTTARPRNPTQPTTLNSPSR
ncbi:UNVERIFIED_CONTAM: Peroxidase 31 [Sesamum latifolium]|uniref:peroxidase n=1 Tax=Sesamum latifolium TaxID=2727402 RepID=A0AAW2Y7M9_9LAMI